MQLRTRICQQSCTREKQHDRNSITEQPRWIHFRGSSPIGHLRDKFLSSWPWNACHEQSMCCICLSLWYVRWLLLALLSLHIFQSRAVANPCYWQQQRQRQTTLTRESVTRCSVILCGSQGHNNYLVTGLYSWAHALIQKYYEHKRLTTVTQATPSITHITRSHIFSTTSDHQIPQSVSEWLESHRLWANDRFTGLMCALNLKGKKLGPCASEN